MKKTLAALVLLPLLVGCKDQRTEWNVPARTAEECYEDKSNLPCLVVANDRTSAMLYQKDKKAVEVRVLWHEEDGTWKFADDLHTN